MNRTMQFAIIEFKNLKGTKKTALATTTQTRVTMAAMTTA